MTQALRHLWVLLPQLFGGDELPANYIHPSCRSGFIQDLPEGTKNALVPPRPTDQNRQPFEDLDQHLLRLLLRP